ncbi:hypothetical protein JI62_21250 [Halomonas campaniensis]|uniref:Uncharacterized protein n=1 Tax=Halomonas campaniensis TaxID=213554 RepID=A0A246RUR8_9GAMM|nr:hypothetical protein JI62_21250 [Halomonas campaniensis]
MNTFPPGIKAVQWGRTARRLLLFIIGIDEYDRQLATSLIIAIQNAKVGEGSGGRPNAEN